MSDALPPHRQESARSDGRDDALDPSSDFNPAFGSLANIARDNMGISVSFFDFRERETTRATQLAAEHIVYGNRALFNKQLLSAARWLLLGTRQLEPNQRVKITMDGSSGDTTNFLGPRQLVTRAEILRRSKVLAFAGAVAVFKTGEALGSWLHDYAPGGVADRKACRVLCQCQDAMSKMLAALVIGLMWPDRRSDLSDPVLKEWVRADTNRFTSGYAYATLFFVQDPEATPVFRKNVAAALVGICDVLAKDAEVWIESATPSISVANPLYANATRELSTDVGSIPTVRTPFSAELSDDYLTLAFLATNGRCPAIDISNRSGDFYRLLVAAANMGWGGAAAFQSEDAREAFGACYEHCKAVAGRDANAKVLAGRALHNLAVATPDSRADERVEHFTAALEDPDLQDQLTPWANLITALVAAGKDRQPIAVPCYGRVEGGVSELVNLLLHQDHRKDATPLLSLRDDKEDLPQICAEARARKALKEQPLLKRISSILRR